MLKINESHKYRKKFEFFVNKNVTTKSIYTVDNILWCH